MTLLLHRTIKQPFFLPQKNPVVALSKTPPQQVAVLRSPHPAAMFLAAVQKQLPQILGNLHLPKFLRRHSRLLPVNHHLPKNPRLQQFLLPAYSIPVARPRHLKKTGNT